MGLLGSLGLKPGGCACKSKARMMDEWGVEGTERNREMVVDWLREEQGKRGWLEYFRAAAGAVRGGLVLALNPLDPAPGLLDEALRRARRQSPTTSKAAVTDAPATTT